MGAQDDFELARDFIERTGVESFTMVWDPSFESWRHYGISRNSEAWLLDGEGKAVGDKFFGLDEDRIDELLAEAV